MAIELIELDEALRRRSELLSSLRMTEGDLRDRADRYDLTLDERAKAAEVEILSYLIEEAAPSE